MPSLIHEWPNQTSVMIIITCETCEGYLCPTLISLFLTSVVINTWSYAENTANSV